jgi:hypothetical protein
MAQSFNCPNCGAPLDHSGNGASTISCPYCYGSVIVPPELRNQRSEPVAQDVTMSLAGQAHKLRELSNLVRTNQRDQAISVYSQVYHVDPVQAQQLVDQLMGGGQMVIASDNPLGFGGTVTTVNFGGMSTPSVSMGSVPMAGGVPPTYAATQPQVVYTTTARQGRNLGMWIGCFIVFIVVITIATTVIPIILALVGAFIPFFF